ncbi:unnamed protein product, partial [Closterium sp. NIES-53]
MPGHTYFTSQRPNQGCMRSWARRGSATACPSTARFPCHQGKELSLSAPLRGILA